MKMIKRTLIILIIATTVFTVVKCDRIEDADNIKQEQGDDTLPKDDKKDADEKDEQEEERHKDDKPKEEIKSPVELG